MTVSRIAPQALVRASTHVAATLRSPSPSLRSRAVARLFATRLDQAVEASEPSCHGSALAVHVARLISAAERQRLAASLRSAARAATEPPAALSARVAVDRGRVIAAALLIDTVTMTLESPLPVRARGVARVRLLLSDGCGPLYATGSGSLTAALRGILAAL